MQIESSRNVENEIKKQLKENIEVDRCHCVASKNKIPTCPWTVICRILEFKDEQKILRNAKALKDTCIFIYEDFCKYTIEVRKKL